MLHPTEHGSSAFRMPKNEESEPAMSDSAPITMDLLTVPLSPVSLATYRRTSSLPEMESFMKRFFAGSGTVSRKTSDHFHGSDAGRSYRSRHGGECI